MAGFELLFSYGTLQDETVQLATFGRPLAGQKDALSGYRMDELVISNPTVVELTGQEIHRVVEPTGRAADSIEGVVFEVTAGELEAADVYEGADYRRVSVKLASGLDAWLYVRS